MAALLLGAVVAATGHAEAADDPETKTVADGEAGRRIVAFARAAEGRGFSGVVLAGKGGRVVAAVGVGSADVEGKTPNTPATLFEIASLSKQFTAAAVLRAQELRRLSLDDPIGKHLSDVPEDCGAITVRHLLQHTSGIPGSNSEGGGMDVAEVLPVFLRGGPQHPPGTHWEYWNQGYALLTVIVSRASGRDFLEFCRAELFQRAKLKATGFTGDPAPKKAAVAVGRSKDGRHRSALEPPYGPFELQYRGMGGVVTSAWDLWRWDRALRTDAVLRSESRKALLTPGLHDYALGWVVAKDGGGRAVVSHGGDVRGFHTEMRRFPDEDACVVVLANADDAPVRPLADAVTSLLFGEEPRPLHDTSGDAPSAEVARALTGTYADERGRVLTVEPADGTLVGRIAWSPPNGPVTQGRFLSGPDGALVFFDGSERVGVAFRRGADGRASHVTLTIARGGELAFTRRP